MKRALLPVLLLPALLMACNGGLAPLEFSLPDHNYGFPPSTAGYVALPIIRAASVKPPLPIKFSASGFPADITLTFFENTPPTYTENVVFKVTVGDVPLGTYTGTITGKSGSMTRTAKVSIMVEPLPVRTAP